VFVRKRNSEEIEVSKLLNSFQILVLFYFCFRFVLFHVFLFSFLCVRGVVLFCFFDVVLFFQNKLTFGFTFCFTFRS